MLVDHAMSAAQVTMVRGVDDDGFAVDAKLGELVQHQADCIIDLGNHSIVEGDGRPPVRPGFPDEIPVDQLLPLDVRLAFQRVAKAVPGLNLIRIDQRGKRLRRTAWQVRIGEIQPDQPGLIRLSTLPHQTADLTRGPVCLAVFKRHRTRLAKPAFLPWDRPISHRDQAMVGVIIDVLRETEICRLVGQRGVPFANQAACIASSGQRSGVKGR